MAYKDRLGREYALMSTLKPGDVVQVDDGFEGCFIAWSEREVKADEEDELYLVHNVPECGACGGTEADECPHYLTGQISDIDGDSLVGIYPVVKGT